MPSGEVASMCPPDASGTEPTEWHATPRTVVDERHAHVLPGPLGSRVREPDRPPPGVGRRTRDDLGPRSLSHRPLLLDAGDHDASHEDSLGDEKDRHWHD